MYIPSADFIHPDPRFSFNRLLMTTFHLRLLADADLVECR